jgi:hypothetical protein
MKFKKTGLLGILFISIFVIACEGPQGDPGPIGPQGDAGPTGLQGPQGEEGLAGADGNTNVQTYIYEDPVWGFGSSLNIYMENILTDEVIKNDVILGYVKHTGIGMVSNIPGTVWVGEHYRDYAVFIHGDSGLLFWQTYSIISLEMDGSFTSFDSLAQVEWVKIIIIESTNTTISPGNGRLINPQQAIYDELKNANVDINKYYEVINYYGLDH